MPYRSFTGFHGALIKVAEYSGCIDHYFGIKDIKFVYAIAIVKMRLPAPV